MTIVGAVTDLSAARRDELDALLGEQIASTHAEIDIEFVL